MPSRSSKKKRPRARNYPEKPVTYSDDDLLKLLDANDSEHFPRALTTYRLNIGVYNQILQHKNAPAGLKLHFDNLAFSDDDIKLFFSGDISKWPDNLTIQFDTTINIDATRFLSNALKQNASPPGITILVKVSNMRLLRELNEDFQSLAQQCKKAKAHWQEVTDCAMTASVAFNTKKIPVEVQTVIYRFLFSIQANHVPKKALNCYLMAYGLLSQILDQSYELEKGTYKQQMEERLETAKKTAETKYDDAYEERMQLIRVYRASLQKITQQLLSERDNYLKQLSREKFDAETEITSRGVQQLMYQNQLGTSRFFSDYRTEKETVESAATRALGLLHGVRF